MEERKSNTGLVVLITILVITVLGLTGFVVYDKVLKKDKVEPNTTDNSSNVENNGKQISDIVYGYAEIHNADVYSGDFGSKIIELHSNGNNKELVSYSDRIYSFTMKHDKLFYYTQSGDKSNNEKTYYIDLNDNNLNPVELTSGIDVEYYFDIDENNLYIARQHKGIKKYNFNNKQGEFIATSVGAYELFVLNNKIYAHTYGESSYDNKYYTISVDGTDLEWINENTYDNAKTIVKYKGTIDDWDKVYYLYNNVKVSLSSDRKQLLYGGKIIFKAADGKNIKLRYSTNPNEIAFVESKFEHFEDVDEVYYKYNLSDGTISETSANNVYDVSLIIK